MESPDSGHGYSPHGKGKFAPSRSLGFFQATPCYSQFNKDLDLINLNYILPIDAFWCLLLHEVQHAAFSRPLAESSRLLLWWRGPDRHADTLKSGWQLQTGHILVNTCPIIIIIYYNDLQRFFFISMSSQLEFFQLTYHCAVKLKMSPGRKVRISWAYDTATWEQTNRGTPLWHATTHWKRAEWDRKTYPSHHMGMSENGVYPQL